jgi:hypothetical protein
MPDTLTMPAQDTSADDALSHGDYENELEDNSLASSAQQQTGTPLPNGDGPPAAPQPPAPKGTPPPTWEDVKALPDFQKGTPPQQQNAFSTWMGAMNDYGMKNDYRPSPAEQSQINDYGAKQARDLGMATFLDPFTGVVQPVNTGQIVDGLTRLVKSTGQMGGQAIAGLAHLANLSGTKLNPFTVPETEFGKGLEHEANDLGANPLLDKTLEAKASQFVGSMLPTLNPAGIPILAGAMEEQGLEQAKDAGLSPLRQEIVGGVDALTGAALGKFAESMPWLREADAPTALKQLLTQSTGKILLQSLAKNSARDAVAGFVQNMPGQIAMGQNPTSQENLSDDLDNALTLGIGGGLLGTGFKSLGVSEAKGVIKEQWQDENDQRQANGQSQLPYQDYVKARLAQANPAPPPTPPVATTPEVDPITALNTRLESEISSTGEATAPNPDAMPATHPVFGPGEYKPQSLVGTMTTTDVAPGVQQLFWDGKPTDRVRRVTTDDQGKQSWMYDIASPNELSNENFQRPELTRDNLEPPLAPETTPESGEKGVTENGNEAIESESRSVLDETQLGEGVTGGPSGERGSDGGGSGERGEDGNVVPQAHGEVPSASPHEADGGVTEGGGGESSAPPPTPEQSALLDRIGKALGPKAPADGKIEFSTEHNQPAWVDPKKPGKIMVNPDVLTGVMKGSDEGFGKTSRGDDYLRKLFAQKTGEEVIHTAQVAIRGEHDAEAILKEIPRSEQGKTISEYGAEIDPEKATSPEDRAARATRFVEEHARRLIQRKALGETTEDVWKQGDKPALVRYIQALYQRIKAHISTYGAHPELTRYLKNIEEVLDDAEKSGQSVDAKGPISAAGYADDFSKSNNAKDAEASGRYPASGIAERLKVPVKFIQEHAPKTGEWHHTSKYYNMTDYYDLQDVKDWMEGKGDHTVEGNESTGADTLAEWRMTQKALGKNPSDVLKGRSIKYLEWSGTRNHPRATEKTIDNVIIERKPGQKMVTITTPDGMSFKKSLDTKGFEIKGDDGQFFYADHVFRRGLEKERAAQIAPSGAGIKTESDAVKGQQDTKGTAGITQAEAQQESNQDSKQSQGPISAASRPSSIGSHNDDEARELAAIRNGGLEKDGTGKTIWRTGTGAAFEKSGGYNIQRNNNGSYRLDHQDGTKIAASPRKTDLYKKAEEINTQRASFPKRINAEKEGVLKDAEKSGQDVTKDYSGSQVAFPDITAASNPLSTIKALGSQLKTDIRGVKKYDDWTKAKNVFSADLQKAPQETRAVVDYVRKSIPDPVRREGLTNYLEAGGDANVIRARMDATKDKDLKAGYEAALNLTPEEKQIAQGVRRMYDNYRDLGIKWGVNIGRVENYVNHEWKEGPDSEEGIKTSGGKRLNTSFKYSRQRTLPTYFEGEQIGLEPKTKDVSSLFGAYVNDLNHAILSRKFIKNLSEGKAADGRPLVAPKTGSMMHLADESEGKSPSVLVYKGNVKEAHQDYADTTIPQLANWTWKGEVDGKPVLAKDNMALHPDISGEVKNLFSRSGIRNWMDAPAGSVMGKLGKGAVWLADQANIKGKTSLFGVVPSLFHPVQIMNEAISHRTVPLSPGDYLHEPDLTDPATYDKAAHGLMLAPNEASKEQFMQGYNQSRDNMFLALARGLAHLRGDKAIEAQVMDKIGQGVDASQRWIFESYIPALKSKFYDTVLDRNMQRFDKELKAGTVAPDDLKYLTARQANNAFGHLNYVDIARNPTTQHMMQFFFLAPDFFEARMRHTGQAASGLLGGKGGWEQSTALAAMGTAMFVTARLVNSWLNNGDTKPDQPFSIVDGNKSYMMRTQVGDLYRLIGVPWENGHFSYRPLFRNWRSWLSGRESPMSRFAGEALAGVNYRGEPTTMADAIRDTLAGNFPISLQPILGPAAHQLPADWQNFLAPKTVTNNPISPFEQLLGTLGIQVSRYSPINTTYQMASAWRDAHGQEFDIQPDKGTYPASQYTPLRYALDDGDYKRAAADYQQLLEANKNNAYKVTTGLRESLTRRFTGGSPAAERAFVASLPDAEKQTYEAAEARRQLLLQRFAQMRSQMSETASK